MYAVEPFVQRAFLACELAMHSYTAGALEHVSGSSPWTRENSFLQAAEDSVSVSYSFPAAVVKPGSYVSLTACYSATSSYDRAWRKPNPNDFTVRTQSFDTFPQ